MDIDPEDPLIPRVNVRRVYENGSGAMDQQKQKQAVNREGSEQSTIPSLAPGPLNLREHQEVPTLGTWRLLRRRAWSVPILTARLDASNQKGLAATIVTLFHSDRVQQHRQFVNLKAQTASVVEHVGNLVEGLHQAQLHRGVLFRLAEGAAPACRPS